MVVAVVILGATDVIMLLVMVGVAIIEPSAFTLLAKIALISDDDEVDVDVVTIGDVEDTLIDEADNGFT